MGRKGTRTHTIESKKYLAAMQMQTTKHNPDAPIVKEELVGDMAKYATAIGKSLPR